jgi:CBS domain-containing protein
MAARTLREIMTAHPKTADPKTPVYEVARLMKSENVGSIPVVEGGKLVGIVTDRDLCLDVLGERKPDDSPVSDFMTTRPQTATSDTTIHAAAQLMQTHQIRRLPVVDGDNLVGIVALADLAVDTASEGLKAETLEEISQHTSGSSNA